MTEKRERVDWDALEPHYRAGIRALKDIGAEFGVSDAAIIKHAKRHDWSRNLLAKIQAKADAKVSAAMVSAEVSETKALTEAVRVEVEAEVQARIRLAHRADIERTRRITNQLLEVLEQAAIGEETLREHASILRQLADTQKSVIAMEREAYGIDSRFENPADKPAEIDHMEGARRLAFALARASAALPATVH